MNRNRITGAATLTVCLMLTATAWAQSPRAGNEDPYPVPNFIVDNKVGFAEVDGGGRLHPFLLTCHRRSGECQLIEADYVGVKGAKGFIHIGLPFTYAILSWDANGIVAQNDEAICVTDRLVLTFADKSAVLVKSLKKPRFKPLVPCETFKSETVQLYKERMP